VPEYAASFVNYKALKKVCDSPYFSLSVCPCWPRFGCCCPPSFIFPSLSTTDLLPPSHDFSPLSLTPRDPPRTCRGSKNRSPKCRRCDIAKRERVQKEKEKKKRTKKKVFPCNSIFKDITRCLPFAPPRSPGNSLRSPPRCTFLYGSRLPTTFLLSWRPLWRESTYQCAQYVVPLTLR
jgi:hypothetical protein